MPKLLTLCDQALTFDSNTKVYMNWKLSLKSQQTWQKDKTKL